jgi:hypothetical protein
MQEFATSLMRPSIHIGTLSHPRNYVDAWQKSISEGWSDLNFDAWLERLLNEVRPGTPQSVASPNSVLLHQNLVEVELAHGGLYDVSSPARGIRRFRCLLDGTFPWIAFLNRQTGQQYPWVTINSLFTIDELKTIKRIL